MRLFCCLILFFLTLPTVFALPSGFVYLQQVAPTILQDIRYAGSHNVIGRPIAGYAAATCILTRAAAEKLAQIQKALQPLSLSLKVYDCYRPTQAVADFFAWSQDLAQEQMKVEFYPHVEKTQLFPEGYFALQSGHSRGSTVDLTLVTIPVLPIRSYSARHLITCTAPQRYRDNSVEMGTAFDCLDPQSFLNAVSISPAARQNRTLLKNIMVEYGFVPYAKEWWHFTLRAEPYLKTAFNFPVQ